VMTKNEEGRKPGSTFLLADGMRKCGNASTIHHTVIWIKMVVYFVFNLVAIDLRLTGLISKGTGRGYKDCSGQTAGTNVGIKDGNVAIRFPIPGSAKFW
jgi:hypothetical protein